ncbi:MFS transporter [Jatrophihabitans sp.]|uniref:MFS transporter n=1 Tax=Jatrophihabitans sp. TaxID=1932789 RepID=UPI0030C70DC9|nr:transporter [Jatrophihabitans sp.]
MSAHRFRKALQSRDLRLLCAAEVIDGLGTWASTTVLVVYVFDRTGSTTWVALLSAARWLPGLLLAGYGGVIADRYERTRVMVGSASASFAVMIGLAVLVASDGPLWAILAVTAGGAIAGAPYGPAAGALTPEVVPESDLSAANSLFGMLESLIVVLGPALGGLLAAGHHPVAGISLNAASFLVAAVIASRLRAHSTGDASAAGTTVFTAMVAGVTALRSNLTSTVLVLFCALANCTYGASSVVFVRLSEQLGSGTTGYAYMLAGMAVGTGLAAGVADRLSASHRLAPVLVAAIVVQALPFAAVAWARTPALGFALMAVSGMGFIVVNILCVTALQRDTPHGSLGRVLSLLSIACMVAAMVSSFAFAAALEAYGLHPSLYAIGFGFPVLALVAVRPLYRADRKVAAQLAQLEPRVAVIEALDLFAEATRATLEELARAAEVVEFPAAASVVREGEPADALWILIEGRVSVTVDGTTVRTMNPGTYFGEIGLLRGIARTASVHTDEASVLWRISSADFLSAIESGSASTSLRDVTFARLARTHPRLAEEAALDPTS